MCGEPEGGKPRALFQNPGTISLFCKNGMLSQFRHLPNFQLGHAHVPRVYVHVYTRPPPARPPARAIRNPNMLKVSGATSTEIYRDPAKPTKINHIAQRSFFGPSGGKSNAAHPFSILPRSNFELFCDERPTTSDKWKRSAEAAVAHIF